MVSFIFKILSLTVQKCFLEIQVSFDIYNQTRKLYVISYKKQLMDFHGLDPSHFSTLNKPLRTTISKLDKNLK